MPTLISWGAYTPIVCLAAFPHLTACAPASPTEILEGDHRISLELVSPHQLGHGRHEAEVVVPIPFTSSRTSYTVGAVESAPRSEKDVPAFECRAFLRVRGYTRGAARRPSRILILDADGARLTKRLLIDDAQNDHTLFVGRVDGVLKVTAVLRLRRPFTVESMEAIFVHVPNKTRAFLETLDAGRYERQGSDYANPRYAHDGLLESPDLDGIRSYDFGLVQAVERRLLGIDRKTALARLFGQITGEIANSTDRHLAVLRFLHKSSFHHAVQPMHAGGETVSDPLVLLELGDMRCGHINQLGVDLFDSVGVAGRMVQFGHHQGAEIRYDGGWHYLDGDIFGNGEAVRRMDGTIPSIVELSENPLAIDALTHYHELRFGAKALHESRFYPSWFFFSPAAYDSSNVRPSYYVKNAKGTQLLARDYGWRRYETVPDFHRRLHDLDKAWAPGAVKLKRVTAQRDSQENHGVFISWSPSRDRDADVLGYRVFVSKSSRGWCYQEFAGAADIRSFWSDCGGWKPEMYEAMFRQPLHEVALATTPETHITLELPSGSIYFVTVMPFDAHGERVGKQSYAMSAELRLELGAASDSRRERER